MDGGKKTRLTHTIFGSALGGKNEANLEIFVTHHSNRRFPAENGLTHHFHSHRWHRREVEEYSVIIRTLFAV